MSTTTLTIALNNNRPNDLSTFAFLRGFDGRGHWFTQTATPSMPAGVMVHVILQSELTRLARENGVTEAHNFSVSLPKPVKTAAVRGPRKPKAEKSGLIGGFNPFAVG